MTSIALPYLAVASVRGTDAQAFLQAQLSADIDALAMGEATFGCYCSPRGQVYGLLLVARQADGLLLIAAAELLPAIVQRLRLFVLRARVEITMRDELGVYGAAEPGAPPAAGGPVFRPLPEGPGYHLAAASPSASPAAPEWKARELALGIAWLGAATSERFIPQMLGFDALQAVSFRKGCYPGQEVIARARYLGQVKRRPLRLRVRAAVEAPPGSSAAVLAGTEWLDATVIDSAPAGSGGETVLFLVAPHQDSAPVETLRCAGRDYACATI